MPPIRDDSAPASPSSAPSSVASSPRARSSSDTDGEHTDHTQRYPVAKGTTERVVSGSSSSGSAISGLPAPSTPFRQRPIGMQLTPTPTSPNTVSTYPSFVSSAAISSDSPSASVMLRRTNETLEELSRQLGELEHSRVLESDPDLTSRCCCGALADCPTLAARDRVDAKLKLCGEIGTALLQRYEALEQKYHRAEKQLEAKRKALSDSLRHVANLERANTTHLAMYAEQTRAFEALEKRYTQALHTQTLTQQSLAHVRGELSKSRAASTALAIDKTISQRASLNEDLAARFAEAERRFEDARTLYHAESRKLREELKWRRMAEDRIADLEAQLTTAGRELEDVKAARAKDAQDLLANAKERLESLHAELSETFNAAHPSETPEYLRTLEDLVASNALLKHDTSELARTLSHTLEENRALKDEIDELRLTRVRPGSRPLSTELRPLLMRGNSNRGHDRTVSTGSNPIPAASDSSRPLGHARVVSAAQPRTPGWGHRRDSSIAPSFTSTSTSTEVTSPSTGLGLQSVSDSPLNRSPDTYTPLTRARSSSGGIGYVHNGVPRNGSISDTQRWKRARPRSSIERRSLTLRAFGVGEAINEPDEPVEAGSSNATSEEARSTHSTHSADDSFTSEGSRKRASVLLPGVPTSPRLQFDALHDPSAYDLPPYQVDGPTVPQTQDQKRAGRRTLLLLSRSMGVQTDPIPEMRESPMPSPRNQTPAPETSTPMTPAEPSETASLHDRRNSLSGAPPSVTQLLEFLTKVLTRLRGVDIPTLNRRLKKQNLPSDVGHVSRTTISSLQTEIAGMRHRFRGLLDNSNVSRRELGLLLTLLRDVFTDLLELQSTVNNVTIDPKLAKKLRREAFEDEKKEVTDPQTGFWGIAAPITNYFLPTAQKPADGAPPSPSKRARLAQTARAAPKLPASTSASTASVTVEFGGSGARAAPASPKTSRLGVVGGRDVFVEETAPAGQRSVSAPVVSTSPVDTATNSGSLRVRSRASRSELMGIFAGAQAPAPRVRHASSQIFTAQKRAPKERLSTIVDAVLDPANESAIDDEDGPLLERTLRPRGLSDSSIHSNLLLDPHGGIARSPSPVPISPAPVTAARPLPARAVAVVTQTVNDGVASGMLGTITRRLYGLREEPKVKEKDDVRSDTPTPSTSRTSKSATPIAASVPKATSATSPTNTRSSSGGFLTSPPLRSRESELALAAARNASMEAAEAVNFTPGSLTRWR